MLLAFFRFCDTSVADLINERIAHVGYGRAAIEPALVLHLDDDVLQSLLFILIEFQRPQDKMIALDKLCRGEAHGYALSLSVVFYEMAHGVKAAVHRSSVVRAVTEVLPERTFLILRYVYRVAHKLVDALIP